jgi:hypothetical protein
VIDLRKLLIILLVVIAICLVLAAGWVYMMSRALNFNFPMSSEELMRVTSPEGTLDAVFLRSSAAAFDSFHYTIHIVPVKADANFNSPYVFYAHKVTNATISWSGNRTLQIEYDEANIVSFTNYAYPFGPKNFIYKVNITEIHRKNNSESIPAK